APGNSEVRRELQRLYVQRDGVEKTRLKLTRGALGRLYSRNGLYERAIAEFHAVLREESDLPDVRVALAEALWREGRRLEAVETCLDILEGLPNCLKANLILGEIWVRGGHEDAGEEKLRLARELDPENLVAQDLMGRDSPLPPQEVYLEEWTGTLQEFGLEAGEEEVDLLPAVWGAEDERAVDLVGGAARDEWDTGEAMPDWMQEMGMAANAAAAGDARAEAAEEGGEMLPDWLQELMGDEVAPADHDVTPLPSGELMMEDQEIEQGEVPDWLRAMDLEEQEPGPVEEIEPETLVAKEAPAPEEVAVEPPLLETEARAGAVPESLRALVEAGILDEADLAAAMSEMTPDEIEAQRAEEVPDWLRELMGEEERAVSPDEAVAMTEPSLAEGMVIEPPAEELPDWLRELGEPVTIEAEEELVAAAPVVEEEELPDWLRELGEPAIIEEGEEELVAAVPVEEEEELPDWLRELGEPVAREVEEEQELEPTEAVDVPDYVFEAREEAPAPEEVAVEPPLLETEARAGAVPESLRALVEAGILDEADLAAAMSEMTPDEIEVQRAEEVPDWLRELMGEEIRPPITAGEAPVISAPPELEAEPELAAEEERPTVEETAVEPPAPELVGWITEEEEPRLEAEAELPEWLRELQVQDQVAEEPLEAPAEIEEWIEAEEVEDLAPEMPVAEAAAAVPQPAEPLPEIAERIEVEEVEELEPLEEPAALVREPELDLATRVEAEPANYQARLELARSYRDQASWKDAVDQYERLVSAQKFLPAVLEDLRALIDQGVEPARVYQLMGDAHMHQNELDDALDMYRRARKALLAR
ncbi:MAG TPA: tetratricopeptide repeat protein, partial [Anaerolineae bacterium]|nr:tetratricopeptide repeat protein [Anaerolineae bacterium]